MASTVATKPKSEDGAKKYSESGVNNVFILRVPTLAPEHLTNEAATKVRKQEKTSLSERLSIRSSSRSVDGGHNHRVEGCRAGDEVNGEDGEGGCVAKFTSCRWVLGYMCCAARFAQSSIRQCMGMAVVCMTLRGPSKSSSTTTAEEKRVSDFLWSAEFEGLILNAFNIGFFLSPIIGGHIAGSVGGKRVVMVSLLAGSLVTICLPLTSDFSDIFLVVFRVVAGLFLGAVDPAIQTLWARWAPLYEKAQLTTCSYTGLSLAGVVTFFISGHLCDIQLNNGWPFIFYFFGGFTFMCAIPWMFLVYDSPDEHSRILDKEKALISKGKVQQNLKMKTPWKSMLFSLPFWAIVTAHVTYTWVTSWVMSYLPKYFNDVMKFDVKENGLYSSLPFVGRLLSGLVCGFLSDKLQKSGLLSTGRTRKLFQIAGCVGCSCCMLAVGFLDHRARTGAVILLVLALSFQNFTSVAFRINHLDIAPRFAGVMMGMSVTIAMAVSLTGPPITAAIIKEGTQQEWLGLFILVAALNIIGAIIFSVFGSADVQQWALPPAQHPHTISVIVNGAPSVPMHTKDKDIQRDIIINNYNTAHTADENTSHKVSQPGKHGDNVHCQSDTEGTDCTGSHLLPDKTDGAKQSNNGYSSGSIMLPSSDEECGAGKTSVTTFTLTPHPSKRALSHTVSMPAASKKQTTHAIASSLLRKRISSSDLHNQTHDSKSRLSASVKPALPTHIDMEIVRADQT